MPLFPFAWLSLVLLVPATAWAQAPQPTQPAPSPAPSSQPAPAAQPAPPPFSVTKVDGTDNVYIFRYRFHQAMFIVTPQGVIATDPIALGVREGAKTYVEEIQKITKAPIRYVIYSHSHYDHIAGGKPFKDVGAKFIAHKAAKERLTQLKNPDVVIPDEVVDNKRTITLGGTTLELHYVGRNHSDNMLVMRLPKEKIVFVVDFIPIQGLQWRNMQDYPSTVELERSIERVLAMDWERMIAGHPGPGGRQIGSKKDAEEHLAYLRDLSAEVKKANAENKCYETAMKEVKLPKYASFANYEQHLAGNVERYCAYYRVGG
jgi:glyoxylase-like metal-dependent hydrolase (beta-lactamase superfamily II)